MCRELISNNQNIVLRQADLAEKSGIGEDYWLVSRFEREGKGSIDNLFKLYSYFNTCGIYINIDIPVEPESIKQILLKRMQHIENVTPEITPEQRMKALATNIKVARKVVGKIHNINFRQEDLAEKSGIGEDYWLVSRFEREGKGSLLNYIKIIDFFKKYGFNTNFFYEPISVEKNKPYYLFLDNEEVNNEFHISITINNFIIDNQFTNDKKDIVIYILPTTNKG